MNARDVTDARRAERRLRALFEASNDIVTILQPDGNWFASPAGTRLLGHLPGYEPEGGLLSLVHPDDLDRRGVGAGGGPRRSALARGSRSSSVPAPPTGATGGSKRSPTTCATIRSSEGW